MEAKRVQDSFSEQLHIVRPTHINGYGRLFGGVLMQWIDEMAGIVARRHCGTQVTTAAVDNLKFKAGAYQNDIVVLRGKVTYVGRTSMEVRVDTYVEDESGKRKPINRAYLVMVSIDENDKPIQVPGLILERENDRMEWENAKKRYEFRKLRKEEGF